MDDIKHRYTTVYLETWRKACVDAGLECGDIKCPVGPFPGGIADEYMEETAQRPDIVNVRIVGNSSYPQLDQNNEPYTKSELTVSAVVAGNVSGEPSLWYLDSQDYHLRGSFTVYTDGPYEEMEALVRQLIEVRTGPNAGDYFGCARCGTDLTEALVHQYENGGPDQCPHCSLKMPTPSNDWLLRNGFNVETDDD